MADQLISAVGAGDQSRYGGTTIANTARALVVQGWASLRINYPIVFDTARNGGQLNFNLNTTVLSSTGASVRFDFGTGARLITRVGGWNSNAVGTASVVNKARAIVVQGFNNNQFAPSAAFVYKGQYTLTNFNHTQAKLSTNAVNVPFIFGGASLISAASVGSATKFGTIQSVRQAWRITPSGLDATRHSYAVVYTADRAGGLNFNFTTNVFAANARSIRFDFGTGPRLIATVGGLSSASLGNPSIVNSAQGVIAGAGPQQQFGQTITYHAITELDVIGGANLDFNLIENLKPTNALNVPFYFTGPLAINNQGITVPAQQVSAPTIYNLKQYLPSASIYGFQSGDATITNRARVVFASGWLATGQSTHNIRNKNLFVSAGLGGSTLAFGESTIFNRNTYTTISGVQSAQYGTARVEHYRRVLLVGGISAADIADQRITNAIRTITPPSIFITYPSNHMVGGTRHLLPQGFSATTFGARIIPKIQTVYTMGLSGAFGQTSIVNRRQVISALGFFTGGSQQADRWGMAHTYNKRQYITMYFYGESGLNPPTWSIWAKIENRNRIVATFGKKETLFAEPLIANNARIVSAQSISSQDVPPFYKSGMVSHRIRTVPLIGIDSFRSTTWAVVYNNARVIKSVGRDCALFGVAKAVKTRRYFDHIGGFESTAYGSGMVSHRVRTITFDSRYAITPPLIKLPVVKLFTRYTYGIGKDLSRLGLPSLSIHFNRITTRWTLQDRYGSPTLHNVTPEVHTYGRNTEEYGDAQVRLQWRPVQAFGANHQVSGKPEIAFRDRTRFITGFNAGVVSDKVAILRYGVQPYIVPTIYAQGIDVGNGALFGLPAVNQRVLYVSSVQGVTVFGNVSVVANTIRVEPGYQELLVGSPAVSLKRRTIKVSAFPDPSEPSKVRISPHTIWAVMEAPLEAIKNHPESGQEYVDSYEVFGSAIVTLKHRKIFVQGVFIGGVGTAELTLKKQYVQPVGIRSYRFGWHSIPVTQTIEQYESSDSGATGSHELSRPVDIGPQTIYPLGLDSFQSGTQVIELFNRIVSPIGIASMIMGTSLGDDTPYMWQGLRVGPRVPIVANGTDMTIYGLTWISNRVREVSVVGFESFSSEYQLEAFGRRMKVTRRTIPVVPRQIAPMSIPSFTSGTPNVRAGVHYIRPDGNADQYRKGAF